MTTPVDCLVIGFAVTGQAAARELTSRGQRLAVVDDGEPNATSQRLADRLGVDLVWGPSRAQLKELARAAGLVVLSPGVPPSHPIFQVADPERIVAELELASSLTTVPVVAVTGTNGKTTVTSLVTSMLSHSGRQAEAVGNIGRPFIEAVGSHEAEMFVVEVSSFQLAWTRQFRPDVACFLNLAEDHLDWHSSLEEYGAAKARIFANQRRDDVAVLNAEDPAVMAWAPSVPGRLVTFGEGGDVTVRDQALVARGEEICRVDELPRSLPHDLSNAAAATAVALEAGARPEACAAALRAGVPMPHRIELVAEIDGVSYYDDSKATTPSAVLAALSGFERAVLIAGGRNKGLDLRAIVRGLAELAGNKSVPEHVRAVVAIGESAEEVAAAFSEASVPVVRAASMGEAVAAAAGLAGPGEAVLLSPGCASFDWYRSYGERGDDFARVVRSLRPEGVDSALQQGGVT